MNINTQEDHQILGVGKLRDFALRALTKEEQALRVKNLTTMDGDQDWDSLNQPFSQDVVELFNSVKAPNAIIGEDKLAWLPNTSCDFTIRSTYEALACEKMTQGSMFRRIRRLEIPQQLRSFTWLARREALFTKSNLLRRRMTSDRSHQEYNGVQEIVLHILRDCIVAKETWMSIVDNVCNAQLFSEPFRERLDKNLNGLSEL